jgi:acyl-[acyl-carrier-protein] desaturase
MITRPEPSIIKEIEEQRSRFPAGLLSREEKDRLIERGVAGLYRWYLARSQATRNWNPDHSFDWPKLRTDHSPLLNHVVEGFYAVEQFVPVYTTRAIDLVRESYGRSRFQLRWGAEEEKHSDLWLNTLFFLRSRSPQWIEEYTDALQQQRWGLPWDDVPHLACYVVIQERATQLNYLNTVIIATGKSDNSELANDTDPVLAEVAHTIAVDEAAHYHFFLEVLRLHLYYYPAATLKALLDVINNFTMPALNLINLMPDLADFEEATFRAGVYTPRQHINDVLNVALKNLGNIKGRGSLTRGLKRSRLVPDPDGNMRDTAIFEIFDYDAVEQAVQKIFSRIKKHEQKIGLTEINPTQFVPSGLA